jgi:ribosomal protein L12E/L44/L45/RPP1/RPP2
MKRLFSGLVLVMACIAAASLTVGEAPAQQIDPAKLKELQEKFGGKIDPAKLEQLKQRLQNIDPAKLKELQEKFGQFKGKLGGAAAPAVDIEALFRKHDADKDGKLTLEEVRKLYDELKTQTGAGRPGFGGFGGIDPARLQQFKDKLKNKQ